MTFVELVVAVAFLGILAALVVYALRGPQAQTAQRRRAAACATPQCTVPVLLTDGFEPPDVAAPPRGGSYSVDAPGAIGAWTVVHGSADVVSTDRWNLPMGGQQSVELGGPAAAIRRAVGGLQSGHTFKLGFQYAVDTCAPSASVRLQVGDLDTTLTATNRAVEGYRSAIYSFATVGGGAQQLTFTGSGGKAGCGMVLDNILVTR